MLWEVDRTLTSFKNAHHDIGFHGKTEKRDDQGCVVDTHTDEPEPEAASYWDVFLDKRIMWIIVADVFHV